MVITDNTTVVKCIVCGYTNYINDGKGLYHEVEECDNCLEDE